MAESLTPDTHEERDSEELEVENGDLLNSNSSCYLILDFMGEGNFGKVAQCMNLITAQDIALKILKTEEDFNAKRETNMLDVLSALDPVKTNVVQYFEQFTHKGHTCLAFEMLDRNLNQFFAERQYEPLSVGEIRPIAHQLLTALDALRGLGVIHCDLKPDNVMLVNHEDQPFRVKLIDFGVSRMTSEVRRGMTLQPLGYRAPEVILGLPISRAMDMWGLGCVLAFLFITEHMFGICCEYQMVRSIVDVLGQPADDLLSDGYFTRTFFKENRHCVHPKWLLKTPLEYQRATGKVPEPIWNVCSLDEVVKIYPMAHEYIEMIDRMAFISLLKGLLRMDPEQRSTPTDAFAHPFLSMVHLEGERRTSLYVYTSFKTMRDCQMEDSEDGYITCPNSKDTAAPVFSDITSLPDSTAVAAVETFSVGEVAVCRTDDSQEQQPDDAAEETPQVEGLPAVLSPVSASACTNGDCTNLPDGAAAVGAEGGSAEREPAVCRDAAEEESTPDGSADVCAPARGKSRLRRIRKFFSRSMRTVFRRKE